MGFQAQVDATTPVEVPDLVRLPSGRILDLRRPRSEGPLDHEELAFCRAKQIPLAYDPAQIGWVTATCKDDLSPEWNDGAAFAGEASKDRKAAMTEVAERYRFRPWRESEVSIYVSLLDDPKVWDHLPETYPAPLTDEVARALIEISNQADHHQVWAVERNGEVVGQVRLAFNPTGSDQSEGEISYWLAQRFWGQGIGSDLVSLFTSQSFQQKPDLASIFARVHESNVASARVLEKCGYHYEGWKTDSSTWKIYRAFRSGY